MLTRAQLISRSLRANTLKRIEGKVSTDAFTREDKAASESSRVSSVLYLRESLKRDIIQMEALKNKKIV